MCEREATKHANRSFIPGSWKCHSWQELEEYRKLDAEEQIILGI